MIKQPAAERNQFVEKILLSKLELPMTGYRIVRRMRLTDLLQSGLSRRVTLLVAPTGYGKTTLLIEWLSTISRNDILVCWTKLDEQDNEPERFFSYILAGLKKAYPKFSIDVRSFINDGLDLKDFTSLHPLLNEIAMIPHQICLILDDYQTITDERVHEILDYFIAHQPANLRLFISTRCEPPLSLARLRAQRQTLDLKYHDLVFTEQETKNFFTNIVDFELDAEQITSILDATEGWVAGMQLAAMSLVSRRNFPYMMKELQDGHRQISEYLIEEVFDCQDKETRDFLLRTSILNELDASLCDHLTGQKNGLVQLNTIERKNLFLHCIDRVNQRYRYHPLFAQALRNRLERIDPHLIGELHQKACDWLCQNDQPSKAVIHALANGDVNQAVDIINRFAMDEIVRFNQAGLLSGMHHFPETIYIQNPRLGIYYALANIQLRKLSLAESMLKLVERTLANGASDFTPQSRERIEWEIAVLRAVMEYTTGDVDQGVFQTLELMKRHPQDDDYFYGFMNYCLANIFKQNCDFESAARALERSVQFARIQKHPVEGAHAMCELARVRKNQGNLQKAEEIYREIFDHAIQFNLDAGIFALAQSGLAEISLERNQLEEARSNIEVILNHMHQIDHSDLIWDHIVLISLRIADYFLVIDDFENACLYIEKAENIVRKYRKMMASLPEELIDLKIHLLLEQGEGDIAENWLFEETSLNKDGKMTVAGRIAQARIWLAQDRLDQALSSLDNIKTDIQMTDAKEHLLETLVLLSLAYYKERENSLAICAIEQAVNNAKDENYLRVFLDEGVLMKELLISCQAVWQSNQETGFDESYLEFINRLLFAFNWKGNGKFGDISKKPIDIILTSSFHESLSHREIEVLDLFVNGKTIKEVAAILMISNNTAKVHLKRIYSKLGVHSRREVIQRAYEAGMIRNPNHR